MPSFVQWPTSPALLERMQALGNLTASPKFTALRTGIAGDVTTGNREGLLASTDGRDRTMTPLKSKRKGKYAGASGPPLIPFGERSRFIKNFATRWVKESHLWVLVAGWKNIDSARGQPFAQHHLTGVPSRGLPRRNAAGIRPRSWARIKPRLASFIKSL